MWAKSDIDLVFITVDDKKTEGSGIALYANGINVHALLMLRTQFRRMAEGSLRNSFMHSFFAKERVGILGHRRWNLMGTFATALFLAFFNQPVSKFALPGWTVCGLLST